MLKNNSFETVSLQEQLSAAETELAISESIVSLNEAEETEGAEGQGKKFFEKAKEFFIKIAKAIVDALKKFTKFFVEAFRKLESRLVNVEKYIKNAKSQMKDASKKLDEPIKVTFLNPGALVGIEKLGVDEKRFDKIYEITKGDLTNGSKLKSADVKDYASALSTVNQVKKSVASIKNSAKVVDKTAKDVQAEAKQGIQNAGKEDKEAVKDNKLRITRANKLNSLARKYVSMSLSYQNKALASAYSATKTLLSGNKASLDKEQNSAKKDAKQYKKAQKASE